AIDIRDRMRGEVLQSARFAVTQALVTSPGWDQAAPHVLEGLCRALDWELGEYWEVDANRESMHFSTAWKRPGRATSAYEATEAQLTYRRGEGLPSRAWESGRPVSDEDLALDQTGVIEAVNPAVTRLFGYEEKELVGQKIEVLIATTHRGSFMSYVERRLTLELHASGALETMGKRKNASLFPLEFLVSSMQVGPRHLFIATLRDISERKAHTDAL